MPREEDDIAQQPPRKVQAASALPQNCQEREAPIGEVDGHCRVLGAGSLVTGKHWKPAPHPQQGIGSIH